MPEAMQFPALRIDALNGAAFLARETNDYDRAHRASTEALANAQHLGDERRAADAMANLGYVTLQRGDPAGATRLFEVSLHIHRALDNRQGIADTLSFLGVAAHHAGAIEDAWRFNEESLSIWETLGDHQATIWARTRRGMLLTRKGDLQDAYREFAGNLTVSREIAYRWGLVWSLYGLANLAALRGARELAIDLLLAGTATREAVGLRLPPAEQAEIDQLTSNLGNEAGAEHTASGPITPERLQTFADAAAEHLAR
jgi:tetratricopeptide (TPR) repeat protein